MTKVLVVDDEENISELIKFTLEREGYLVELAHDGRQALTKVEEFMPELIVLDCLLPEIDGIGVCRQIKSRKETSGIPIIMLSAKSRVSDKVLALESGVDDYMTKPFSPRELSARIKARLRGKASNQDLHVIHPKKGVQVVNQEAGEILVRSKRLRLAPREFKLLQLLMSEPGRVFKRTYLLNNLWGRIGETDSRTVDVHIRCLRQKIENNPGKPELIETVRGVGYRFNQTKSI